MFSLTKYLIMPVIQTSRRLTSQTIKKGVCVIIKPSCICPELKEFREYLVRNFQRDNIPVFETNLDPNLSLDEQLEVCDKMDTIQYVVILNERLHQRGDVDLRSKDTKLEVKPTSLSFFTR